VDHIKTTSQKRWLHEIITAAFEAPEMV